MRANTNTHRLRIKIKSFKVGERNELMKKKKWENRKRLDFEITNENSKHTSHSESYSTVYLMDAATERGRKNCTYTPWFSLFLVLFLPLFQIEV